MPKRYVYLVPGNRVMLAANDPQEVQPGSLQPGDPHSEAPRLKLIALTGLTALREASDWLDKEESETYKPCLIPG